MIYPVLILGLLLSIVGISIYEILNPSIRLKKIKKLFEKHKANKKVLIIKDVLVDGIEFEIVELNDE